MALLNQTNPEWRAGAGGPKSEVAGDAGPVDASTENQHIEAFGSKAGKNPAAGFSSRVRSVHFALHYNLDLICAKRWQAAACALLLFLLNLWLVHELLFTEYLDYMGSIEGTHIALSRWTLENWRDLTWFPLWYGGVPYQNAYPPLHSLITAAVAGALGLTPAHAYHAVTAVLYSLGPAALFLLALQLGRSVAVGAAVGMMYSLLSPSAFLMPSVLSDAGSLWHPRRLQALIRYGEAPHVGSLTLVPLALLVVMIALDKRRPAWWLAAALAAASVALTNWLGGMAFAFAVAAWLLARSEGVWWKNWAAAVLLGLWAYAIACPWIPPSTVMAVRRNERWLSGELSPGRWIWALAALAVVVLLLWIFRRFRAPATIRFAALFLFPMALIPLAAEYGRLKLMPQPERYHLEMEMALVLLVAFIGKAALERMRARTRVVLSVLLIAACLYPALRYRRYARAFIRPADIRSTIEYRVADWIDGNLQGRRVFAAGSHGFWLNVFTDTPQFAGGFDQAAVNPNLTHLKYQIVTGENAQDREGEIAILELKALGVDAVAVSAPGSREVFKPYRNPRKFEGLLPVLWRQEGDTIYSVNRRRPSLAHVIRREDLPVRVPESGLDVDAFRPYVEAIEDPARPAAEMRWRTRHSALVTAAMRAGEILSVQMSHHPGWRAEVNDVRKTVYGDHLGQLVVEPECESVCTVELVYDGGPEMRLARIVSWMALAGGVIWILAARRRGAVV